MRIIPIFATALLVLSACGNNKSAGASLAAGLLARAQAIGKSEGSAPPATQTWSRAELTAPGIPVILVEVPSRGAKAALGLAQESHDTRTYVSEDGISLMIQNGILSGTRGFGDDLMTSDHRGTLANLRRGSGTHTRHLRHLDDLDQLQVTTVSCTVTTQGVQSLTILSKPHRPTVTIEICTGDGQTINNIFMIERGQIIKSAQWVSPSVGPLLIEQIQ